jgi:hypothetical protein
MEIERIALFVNRLSERTKAGNIEWVNETSNSFAAKLGDYKVSISEQYDEDGDPQYTDPDYYIGIYKDGAKTWIDSVNDEEMKDALPGAFKIMQNIYRGAKRSARGFGVVIEELIRALDDEL